MDMVTLVQIQDEIVCLFCSTNTLGKGMYITTLPPAMDK